jgi:DnaJ domain
VGLESAIERIGWPLRTNEALGVLALRPGASPTAIKEAYRDLVKVWHPDRFGADARLRQKAEEKLRELNDAYRVLQTGSVVEVAEARGAAFMEGRSTPAPEARRFRGRWGAGWIYCFVGVVLGCLAGYFVLERGTVRSAPLVSAGESQQGVKAASAPVTQMMADVPKAAGLEGTTVRTSGDVDRARSAPFRIWSLTEAQTARVESVCSRQRELRGQDAYRACVKAQLDVITNGSSAPELQALSVAERESIESVCAEGKRVRGSDAYNRCLNVQVASLAEEPSRPDLSGLSDADRSSVEAACRSAKYREGPVAYDRCLMRFVKLLAETE